MERHGERRAWLVLAMVLLAGGAARGAEPECLDPVALATLQAEVAQARDAALDAALAERGYAREALSFTRLDVGLPGDRQPVEPDGPRGVTPGEEPGTLLGPVITYHCGGDAGRKLVPASFAMGADGQLFLLDVTWVATETREVVACGCPPLPPLPCGAYLPGQARLVYTLPSGARYEGVLTLTVEVPALKPRYTRDDDGCRRQSAPPSMQR